MKILHYFSYTYHKTIQISYFTYNKKYYKSKLFTKKTKNDIIYIYKDKGETYYEKI